MRKRRRWIVASVVIVLLAAAYGVYGVGRHEPPGTVHPRPVDPAVIEARRAALERAGADIAAPRAGRQILFGDLHVHTTFSADAFLRSLPMVQGEGAHPPADACDFARYCSSLDFFALTDHAESLTARHWRESIESVRQCNAVAGDAVSPDLVAFIGFEWSQVGRTPEEHYGHRNVVFRETDDAHLPRRPIGATGVIRSALRTTGLPWTTQAVIPLRELPHHKRYLDLFVLQQELRWMDDCPAGPGIDPRELPEDCREIAHTPGELFAKLRAWNVPSLVIPHGTTWGFYTPPGYAWDKSLSPSQRDPELQRLVEVYSGHGNSEEYRRWQEGTIGPGGPGGPGGQATCPAATSEYEPCCRRAGEIVRARCRAEGAPAEECERRADAARSDYVRAGVAGHLTVAGATVEEWRDCGQCRDCFEPAFQYRPGGSVQYILARGDFSDPARPYQERMGIIASSDNHSARPGTGYKEFARRRMTEATGARDQAWTERIFGAEEPAAHSREIGPDIVDRVPPWNVVHLERQSSFFLTGGLVAIHAEGRSRDAIWQAMQRREVYGTSGERILLWFDLTNRAGAASDDRIGSAGAAKRDSHIASAVRSQGPWPMGSDVILGEAPRFEVRAVGSPEQLPGCPDATTRGLPADRVARLCLGECFHPSERRRRISRIEVVRIRPQARPDEPVAGLIEDPWRRVDCPADPAGCRVTLDDPDFPAARRDTLYYVRAIQEATPGVNARALRCEREGGEACARSRPCYGDHRTALGDDCLAPAEERAWSSPIWVRWTEPAQATDATEAAAGGSP